MATLHPAALLRNPNNKPAAFEDFLKMRAKIDELNQEAQLFLMNGRNYYAPQQRAIPPIFEAIFLASATDYIAIGLINYIPQENDISF